jgi:hypothetical protein
MTEQHKQELIDWLKEGIELREEYGFNGNLLASMRIALSALNAQPVAYLTWHQGFRSPDDCEDYLVVASNGDKSCDGSEAFPVFTRAAPTADLADLVPDEMTWNQAHSLLDINQCGEDRFSAFMMGANYNRSAILRNIEEAK